MKCKECICGVEGKADDWRFCLIRAAQEEFCGFQAADQDCPIDDQRKARLREQLGEGTPIAMVGMRVRNIHDGAIGDFVAHIPPDGTLYRLSDGRLQTAFNGDLAVDGTCAEQLGEDKPTQAEWMAECAKANRDYQFGYQEGLDIGYRNGVEAAVYELRHDDDPGAISLIIDGLCARLGKESAVTTETLCEAESGANGPWTLTCDTDPILNEWRHEPDGRRVWFTKGADPNLAGAESGGCGQSVVNSAVACEIADLTEDVESLRSGFEADREALNLTAKNVDRLVGLVGKLASKLGDVESDVDYHLRGSTVAPPTSVPPARDCNGRLIHVGDTVRILATCEDREVDLIRPDGNLYCNKADSRGWHIHNPASVLVVSEPNEPVEMPNPVPTFAPGQRVRHKSTGIMGQLDKLLSEELGFWKIERGPGCFFCGYTEDLEPIDTPNRPYSPHVDYQQVACDNTGHDFGPGPIDGELHVNGKVIPVTIDIADDKDAGEVAAHDDKPTHYCADCKRPFTARYAVVMDKTKVVSASEEIGKTRAVCPLCGGYNTADMLGVEVSR